jgi:YHS domain-containing protein
MGLIRILILAVVAVLVYTLYKKYISGPSRSGGPTEPDERLGRLVQDPQCQVYVDSKDAVRRKVKGGDLFFCSEKCADEYLEGERKEA